MLQKMTPETRVSTCLMLLPGIMEPKALVQTVILNFKDRPLMFGSQIGAYNLVFLFGNRFEYNWSVTAVL